MHYGLDSTWQRHNDSGSRASRLDGQGRDERGLACAARGCHRVQVRNSVFR